jgi:Arc/MetJ family transcription regulator
MRTTITIEDELLDEAHALSGISGRSALVRAALQELVARETARRLAALGGTEPQLRRIPRRRPPLGKE